VIEQGNPVTARLLNDFAACSVPAVPSFLPDKCNALVHRTTRTPGGLSVDPSSTTTNLKRAGRFALIRCRWPRANIQRVIRRAICYGDSSCSSAQLLRAWYFQLDGSANSRLGENSASRKVASLHRDPVSLHQYPIVIQPLTTCKSDRHCCRRCDGASRLRDGSCRPGRRVC